MTFKYKVNNLCCANCAAIMERSINKLKGVKEANLSFMSMRLTVDAEAGTSEEELDRQIEKIVKKVESKCSLTKI